MKRGARFITIALTSTVLVGAFLAAAGSASAAAPKCFGKKATIVGTNTADVLKGTAKADVIVARGGNDKVMALAGNDLICGGSGNDKLYGGPGYDRIHGEEGNDQLFSQIGSDDLWGGVGNDTLNGSGPGFVWAYYWDAPNGVTANLSTGKPPVKERTSSHPHRRTRRQQLQRRAHRRREAESVRRAGR